MSDYLSNLIDRSLDRADVVQPRLPSLFEPVQGISSPIPGFWGQEEQATKQPFTDEINTRNVVSQDRPIANRFAQASEQRSDASLTSLRLPTLTPPTNAIQRSQTPNSLLPKSEQHVPLSRPEPTPSPVHESAIQSLFSKSPIAEPQIAERIVSVEKSEIATQPAPSPVQSVEPNRLAVQPPIFNPPLVAVQNATAGSKESPPANDLFLGQDPPMLRQISKNMPLSLIRPAIQAVELEMGRTAAPTPTPVIQVTIGRIEVRATAPVNPPPTQARPKSPVMSLDEYLHQRGGGR
jgi:hypothetical protein